ncbi:zinc finger MYM-type protein 1-like [Limulus polyphemus]|uniref:Zinc finger MYM-type protein 1-like n=1 Tax=Limulus polyphemus TaxID=6850 RepID=A0ABM1BDV6_LIMPO|nr:zinc finger MYM-type protein 1-like [Limulus polyphemus]
MGAAEINVREHFLGFVLLNDTPGTFMTESILHQHEELSLSLENLRGQGYDNGSNMKGKYNGVQKRIMDTNPQALFVPWYSHSLNLVVNDAARRCLEATSFFDLFQRICAFFSGSTHHWYVLLHHVSCLTVKPLSETRWESCTDTLKPLHYHIGDIYDAIMEIADDITLTGSSGNAARIEAKAFANGYSNFKFFVSLTVWYNILFEVNVRSKQLQAKEYDVHSVFKQLEQTKKFLIECRIDQGFEKTLVDTCELAEELEIFTSFEPESVHIKRKKRQFAHEAEYQPVHMKQKTNVFI